MALTKIPGHLLDKSAHVDFADNEQLRIGTGNDLVLKHTGSNTVIHNTTGQLRVRANDLSIQSYSNEEKYIEASENGSVDLYYDNSKKFETTSGGASITGNLAISGNLTVSGTTTEISTTNLQVEDKNIVLNYGSGDTSSNANGAGITIQDAVSSSADATILWDATNDEFDFSHNIAITSGGNGLSVVRSGYDTYALQQSTGNGMSIYNVTDDVSEMHFFGDGKIGIGTTSPDGELHVLGTGGGNGDIYVERTSGAKIHLQAQSANGKIGTSSNHNLGLNTNGTTRVTIDTNGKVGIGETSPENLLHLNGTNNSAGDLGTAVGPGNIPALHVQNAGTTDNNMAALFFMDDASVRAGIHARFTSHSSDDAELRLSTSAGGNLRERMTINKDGYVGIGDANPKHPFKVNLTNGQIAMFGSNAQNSSGQYCGIGLGQVLANNTTYQKVSLVYEGRDNGNYIGNFRVLVDIEGNSESAALEDSKLMIAGQNGYLGVGPGTNLVPYSRAEFHLDQVAAATNVNGGSTVHFGSQQHTDGAMMGITLGYREASMNYRKVGLVAIGRGDNAARQDFAILVDTVSDGGGCRDSDRKIHINGTTGVTTIGSASAQSDTYLLKVETEHGYGRQGSSNSTYFHHETDRSYNYWNEAGYFNGGAHSYSDETLKKDIAVIPDALASVARMNGVTFKWKDPSTRGGKATGEGKQFGVIAQNMLEIDAELPTLSVDPLAESGNEDDGKLYSMDYSRLSPYFIEAIKELKEKLEAAEARIAALEG